MIAETVNARLSSLDETVLDHAFELIRLDQLPERPVEHRLSGCDHGPKTFEIDWSTLIVFSFHGLVPLGRWRVVDDDVHTRRGVHSVAPLEIDVKTTYLHRGLISDVADPQDDWVVVLLDLFGEIKRV
jgi:hypothetical protein